MASLMRIVEDAEDVTLFSEHIRNRYGPSGLPKFDPNRGVSVTQVALVSLSAENLRALRSMGLKRLKLSSPFRLRAGRAGLSSNG
jgi:hypothetical protein